MIRTYFFLHHYPPTNNKINWELRKSINHAARKNFFFLFSYSVWLMRTACISDWENRGLISNTTTTFNSGVARTCGAHGQRTLRGPSPFLFLWPLPHIYPYYRPVHVYLYYMILNTVPFNQYISHGVFWKFESLWWRDGRNGGPWWRNDKWDPLITWLEIRGYHIDDMMRKVGALDSAMEKLGPFALWWRNGEIGNP